MGDLNFSSGDFEQTPEEGPHTKSSKNKAQELMIELDLVSDNYEARPIQLKFELVLLFQKVLKMAMAVCLKSMAL